MATSKKTASKKTEKKPAAAPKAPAKKPAAKPAAKEAAVAKPAAKPVAKPAAKPVAKPKPAPKPVAKPAAKPVVKPAPKPSAKPAVKPVAKPVVKPVAKPVAKSAVKPAAKPVAKSVAKAPEKKPAAPKKPVAPKKPTGKVSHGLPLPPPPPPPDRFGPVKQKPLTAAQLKGFRARLATELDYIKGNLDALTRDALKQQSESSGDVGIHSTHMADHGTDNFDRDINLLLASGRQEAIYAIEDALRRLDGGSFGICEVCGNPIGFDRLDAMPYAKMCISCKKELEKGRGRPTFSPYPSEKVRTRQVESPDGEQEVEIEVDVDGESNELGESRLPTD